MKFKGYNDYVDDVHKKFPKLDKDEIKDIMHYGLSKLLTFNVNRCDVLLKSKSDYSLWLLFGKMFNDTNVFIKYALKKQAFKIRTFYKLNNINNEHDGYYYFGLSDDAYRFYESQKDSEIKIFEYIFMYKLLDELKIQPFAKHLFKIKMPELKKYKHYFEIYETSDAIEL